MSTPITDVITHPFEERHIEFKRSTPWKDKKFKAKITKSILAMANLKDDGSIIVGKEKESDGTYKAVGMIQSDYDSYDSDPVKDFVKDYADPYVNLSVLKPEHNHRKFVVIRIEEFDTSPVVCKMDYGNIMHRGKIYTRSRGKPETIEIPSETEMREIIDMAVNKEMRKFIKRLSDLELIRLVVEPSKPQDKEKFDKQLEGIL